ncbi:MAG: hypothetical protein ACPIOQ_36490 [Promethearchaeia archaeon]
MEERGYTNAVGLGHAEESGVGSFQASAFAVDEADGTVSKLPGTLMAPGIFAFVILCPSWR